jgi:DNA replication and repair protein RecF
MHLERFTAENFRNLCGAEFSPAPGMNVIFGENAQGKTNLLEGIYILSTLRSFRTRHLSETLRFGESTGCILGTVRSVQTRHLLAIALGERDRQLMLNRKKVDALQYIGAFNVFLFSYPLLEVIRGGPEERRKFLDRSISVSKTGYLPLLLQYHRAVKHKNALLQSAQKGDLSRKDAMEEVLSFNAQLATHGLEIAKYRAIYVAELQEILDQKTSG